MSSLLSALVNLFSFLFNNEIIQCYKFTFERSLSHITSFLCAVYLLIYKNVWSYFYFFFDPIIKDNDLNLELMAVWGFTFCSLPFSG